MPPYSYLSVRASCDRCRFHKLKCVANSDENHGRHDCARCIRAKVECVYSQRASAKRQKTLVPEADSQISSKEDVGLPTPSTGPSSTGGEESGDVESSHMSSSEIWAMLNTPDCVPRPDKHTHPSSTLVNFAHDQPSVTAASTDGPLTSLAPDAASDQFLPSRSIPQSIPRQVSQDTSLGSSTSLPPSMRAGRQAQAQAHGNPDSHLTTLTAPTTQLSNLVADIHKTLAVLTGNCRGSTCPSFNFREYPIGAVLHLAKDLVDIVSRVKSTREALTTSWEPIGSDISIPHTMSDCTAAPSTGSHAPAPSFPSQGFNTGLATPSPPLSSTSSGLDNVMDAPTKLLAMGCYFSLRRLYYLVFTHFEGYLITLWQAPSSRELLAHNLARGRGLQAGDLPSADEMCSGMNTAVRLVLETLQSAEDVLEIPDNVATSQGGREADSYGYPSPMMLAPKGQDEMSLVYGELARTFTDQATKGNGGPVHSEMDGLGSKVQKLRGMLKERMRWTDD